jgi:hypothetical protein
MPEQGMRGSEGLPHLQVEIRTRIAADSDGLDMRTVRNISCAMGAGVRLFAAVAGCHNIHIWRQR